MLRSETAVCNKVHAKRAAQLAQLAIRTEWIVVALHDTRLDARRHRVAEYVTQLYGIDVAHADVAYLSLEHEFLEGAPAAYVCVSRVHVGIVIDGGASRQPDETPRVVKKEEVEIVGVELAQAGCHLRTRRLVSMMAWMKLAREPQRRAILHSARGCQALSYEVFAVPLACLRAVKVSVSRAVSLLHRLGCVLAERRGAKPHERHRSERIDRRRIRRRLGECDCRLSELGVAGDT